LPRPEGRFRDDRARTKRKLNERECHGHQVGAGAYRLGRENQDQEGTDERDRDGDEVHDVPEINISAPDAPVDVLRQLWNWQCRHRV
jgi:hypothetical protein